jgi:hypothetical protein
MQERKEDGNKKRNMSKSPEDDDDGNKEMVRAFKSHVYKETTLTCLLSFEQLIVKNTMPLQRETKFQVRDDDDDDNDEMDVSLQRNKKMLVLSLSKYVKMHQPLVVLKCELVVSKHLKDGKERVGKFETRQPRAK